MALSNSRSGLRKVAGHKNKGYLAGMDFDEWREESAPNAQCTGGYIVIPRYEELKYLRLEDEEE